MRFLCPADTSQVTIDGAAYTPDADGVIEVLVPHHRQIMLERLGFAPAPEVETAEGEGDKEPAPVKRGAKRAEADATPRA